MLSCSLPKVDDYTLPSPVSHIRTGSEGFVSQVAADAPIALIYENDTIVGGAAGTGRRF